MAELIASTQPTPVPSVVGLSHIAEVRAAAAVFADWDSRHGSGFVRESVNAQLGYCAKLLNARCSETVRPALFSAVGYLGNITAFTAFDAYAHDDARRILASLIMVTGDPREAAALGAQALDGVVTLRSRRAADDLRELRRFSEPHLRLPEVAELRHRIGTVVTA